MDQQTWTWVASPTSSFAPRRQPAGRNLQQDFLAWALIDHALVGNRMGCKLSIIPANPNLGRG
eukprot:745812-Hanusia_phi.AAC.5